MGSGAQERERAAFSQRLAFALAAIGWKKLSPTEIAVDFNRRTGSNPITSHAVRKWITGGAIPVQERLSVLAAWLQVEPEWLRYGNNSEWQDLTPTQSPDVLLLADLARLDAASKRLVFEMINILLRTSRK